MIEEGCSKIPKKSEDYIIKGLINTRGITTDLSKSQKSGLNLKYTDKDLANGYRIGPSTLNFRNNERREIRIVNIYTFGMYTLEMIWTLNIRLKVIPPGTMSIHPKILQIRVLEHDCIIDSELPCGLMKLIVDAINEKIGNMQYDAKYLHLDQIEGLSDIGLISRPDALFERLIGIAETRNDLDLNQYRFTRMKPDSVSLILTIQKVV